MKRSHWAWGYEEELPTDEARAALATQAGALLGAPLAPLPLPSFDPTRVRASRLRVPEALAEVATTDARARALHTYGKAYPDLVRSFRGDFSGAPDLVVRAESEDDVLRAMHLASKEGAALVPFGGGTSVTGGVEHEPGARPVISLDMTAMDRVLEVDEVSRAAKIQAGASGPGLEAALKTRGLTLRFFPQSFEHSTLGGWLATRAGGHFATLYTHIDDLTESVRMVTPGAGVFETRRLPASGAGPDPNRLVLGSEGALGVITSAWMRVFCKPTFRAHASVRFADFTRAVAAVRSIAQSGLFPANCRLLDAREALVNAVAQDGSSVLVLAFESHDHELRDRMERALKLATREGGRTEGARYASGEREKDAGRWRASFLRGPHLQSALVSCGALVDTFETACTWSRFDALRAEVTRAVTDALSQIGAKGSLSCRFTHVYPDGPAPYFTFIAAGGEGDLLEQWAAVKRAASDAIASSGGTITHHHAVGRTHRAHYEGERPAAFGAALRAVKNAFDPSGIMNPGVLV